MHKENYKIKDEMSDSIAFIAKYEGEICIITRP